MVSLWNICDVEHPGIEQRHHQQKNRPRTNWAKALIDAGKRQRALLTAQIKKEPHVRSQDLMKSSKPIIQPLQVSMESVKISDLR